MKKSEFINLFADLADDAEIDETLASTELVKGFINKGLTLEAFKGVASGKCGFTTLRAFSPLIPRVYRLL